MRDLFVDPRRRTYGATGKPIFQLRGQLLRLRRKDLRQFLKGDCGHGRETGLSHLLFRNVTAGVRHAAVNNIANHTSRYNVFTKNSCRVQFRTLRKHEKAGLLKANAAKQPGECARPIRFSAWEYYSSGSYADPISTAFLSPSAFCCATFCAWIRLVASPSKFISGFAYCMLFTSFLSEIDYSAGKDLKNRVTTKDRSVI